MHDRSSPYDAEIIREEGLCVEDSPSEKGGVDDDASPIPSSLRSEEDDVKVWILKKPVRRLPFSDSSIFLDKDGDESVLELEHLEQIAKTYPFPVGSILALPEKGSTSLHHFPNFMAVSLPALYAGFRVPIHPFFQEILHAQGTNPIQLHPNSWRNFCCLFLHCRELNVDPTLEVVRNLLSTRDMAKGYWSWKVEYMQLVMKPSNLGPWRNEWFLLRVPGSFGVNIHPGRVFHFSCPAAGSAKKKQLAEKKALSSKFDRSISYHYGQLMTPDKLEELGLSSLHPCGDSSAGMEFAYLEGIDDLEKGLVMGESSCARVRPCPVVGSAGLLHGHAEAVDGGVGDVAVTLSPVEKAPVVEVGDSPDPPLVNLKVKASRKKSNRRVHDSYFPKGSVGLYLENIVRDSREALSVLGKEAPQAADVGALHEQIASTELKLNRAKTERDAALSELSPLKKERDAVLLELSTLKKERDVALSHVLSLQAELPFACKKSYAEGRQKGADEYVASYRMKARYTHYATFDFFYGLRVGARQVLNHYNLEPIRLNARDNAGEEYTPKRPYKPPAIGFIKGDHEDVLEAWGVTELIDEDPFLKKPLSPTATSTGLKRTRDGSLRGDASSAPTSKP